MEAQTQGKQQQGPSPHGRQRDGSSEGLLVSSHAFHTSNKPRKPPSSTDRRRNFRNTELKGGCCVQSQGQEDSGGRGNERGGLRGRVSNLGLSYERGDSTKLKGMSRREARFYLCLWAGRSSGVLLGTDDVPLASAHYGK